MLTYEQQRLANIRQNQEILESLGLREESAAISEQSKQVKQERTRRQRERKDWIDKAENEAPVVLRRSKRSRGIAPPSYTAERVVESELGVSTVRNKHKVSNEERMLRKRQELRESLVEMKRQLLSKRNDAVDAPPLGEDVRKWKQFAVGKWGHHVEAVQVDNWEEYVISRLPVAEPTVGDLSRGEEGVASEGPQSTTGDSSTVTPDPSTTTVKPDSSTTTVTLDPSTTVKPDSSTTTVKPDPSTTVKREPPSNDGDAADNQISPMALLQELYRDDVWKLLICCILMSRVSSAKTKETCISGFFGKCPHPSAALDTDPDDIHRVIAPLGLFDVRMKGVIDISQKFLQRPVFDVGLTPDVKIYGIGEFGCDSYDIFCRGKAHEMTPNDKALRGYCHWKRTMLKQSEQDDESE